MEVIFDSCAKTVLWEVFSSTNGLGQLDINMKMNKVGPLPHTVYKN